MPSESGLAWVFRDMVGPRNSGFVVVGDEDEKRKACPIPIVAQMSRYLLPLQLAKRKHADHMCTYVASSIFAFLSLPGKPNFCLLRSSPFLPYV